MNQIRAEDIEPEVRHVNYVPRTPNDCCIWGPRRINEFELILVLQGEFEFINVETGEQVRQPAGTILVILPDELHSYRLLSDKHPHAFFSCIHLELKPGINRASDPLWPVPAPQRLTSIARDTEIVELFRQADQENRRNGRYRDTMLSLLVKQIWLRLSEKWSTQKTGQMSIRVGEMLQYLRDHRLEHPGRNELANHFHLSPQHINLIFKKEVGMPPISFVHRELMREAYRLLLVEQLNVKETAFRLGFSNQFYFSRVFKKEMGFPPGVRK